MDSASRHRLTSEQWCSLVEQGIDIPLTIPIHGTSMLPLIRYGRDPATIVPLKREPLVGDIVLFRRRDVELVIHRVWQVLPDGVQTWGDNCRAKDRPVRRRDVLGLVVSVNRDGREIPLDTDRQRRSGVKWMTSPIRRPLWFGYRKARSLAGRMIRRVWPGFHRDRS